MEVWEYKVMKFDAKTWLQGGKVDSAELEKALNDLGQIGRELVTIFDSATANGQTRNIVASLKRRKG